MSNCWAIVIGINQYQGFQPLMQAQNDAVGIRRYLIEDAGFAPENCVLLSDMSTSTEQEAVFPDRIAIKDWIETVCQGRVQRDDTLWFYFSGYGAQADNQDYLMPVDGDPAQVKQTGIALQDVVKHLKQAPTKNTIMVLDMNRSQSALAGQAIGEQVTKLARKARIPLILSCQPNEFSHETLAVRHGLFTAALLEGLRYDGCVTLSHLERYLIERIPELCEHHWRPIQNPVVVLPEEQKFQLLWHQQNPAVEAPADDLVGAAPANVLVDSPDPEFESPEFDPSEFDPSEFDPPEFVPEESTPLIPEPVDEDFVVDNPDADFYDGADLIPESVPELILEDELPEEPSQEPFSLDTDTDDGGDIYGSTTVDNLPDDTPAAKGRTGGCLGLLAALGAALLLGAVLLRNQHFVQNVLGERIPPEWLASIGLDPNGESLNETAPSEAPTDGEIADGAGSTEEPIAGDDPAADSEAAVDNPDAGIDNPDDAETPDSADEELDVDLGDIGLDGDTPNAVDTPDAVDNPDAIDNPDDEPAEGDDTGADPVEAPDTNNTVAASSNTVTATAGTDTAALLEDARRSLRPSQASRFASAIATARQIPPGDPNYDQAQADIQRWSQVILDLAEGRAAETELDAAIAAAKLIPREPANIYQTAQERISLWQTRADARALIREAQAIPRLGQASTYQRGILKLQEVPDDLPVEQADAQRLISDWTGIMLTIARNRADQGLFFSAIEAAELIPQGTANYDQAQADIRRWKGE